MQEPPLLSEALQIVLHDPRRIGAGGYKDERGGIDAVTQARRIRSVGEYVTEVGAARAVHHLYPFCSGLSCRSGLCPSTKEIFPLSSDLLGLIFGNSVWKRNRCRICEFREDFG